MRAMYFGRPSSSDATPVPCWHAAAVIRARKSRVARRQRALRRALLLAIFAASLLNLLLAGCAAFDPPAPPTKAEIARACDISARHAAPLSPAREHARVTWTVIYGQAFASTDGRWGETDCQGGECVTRLAGEPAKWDDVCALARLGHEAKHAVDESAALEQIR